MCEIKSDEDTYRVSFEVVSIPNWNNLLSEKTGVSPWRQIVQLDEEEYSVVDGKTGNEVTAISGILQDKQETIGVFEIRPHSGLIIGIEFQLVGLTHKVRTAMDYIEHYGGGGNKKEWWAIPLEYGTWSKSTNYESGSQVHDAQNLDIEDAHNRLFKSAELDLEDFEYPVYLETPNRFLVDNRESMESFEVIHNLAELLEYKHIWDKRRNENRNLSMLEDCPLEA